MSAAPSQLLKEFEELLKVARSAHNLARQNAPSRTLEADFINENTLIRIDEALEIIRERLGQPKWEQGKADLPGFDAYVTTRVYRNSIVHHGGTLNEEFHGGTCTHDGLGSKTAGRRKHLYCYYERFCQSVGAKPLQPGDKLMLSVRRPDFLQKLIEGVLEFARNVVK